MGVIYVNGVPYGDNATDIVQLTRADYEALPSSKLTDNIIYDVTDLTVNEQIIKDDTTSSQMTWSSEKINSNLDTIKNTLEGKVKCFVYSGDLNNLDTSIAECNVYCTNLPVASTLTTVFTFRLDGNPNFMHQIAFVGAGCNCYARRKWSGSWDSWTRKF